jgi:hypothetical protein
MTLRSAALALALLALASGGAAADRGDAEKVRRLSGSTAQLLLELPALHTQLLALPALLRH